MASSPTAGPAGPAGAGQVRTDAHGGVPVRTWPAHAAAVWAFAFAAVSFYWAAGGVVGEDTVGETILQLLGSGATAAAVIWLAGLVKAAGGMLALALVRPWGERLPRWVLLAGSWGAGVMLTAYALVQLGGRAVLAVGLLPTPASMNGSAAWWHLLLWDPWFLLGGVLFLLAAREYTLQGHGADGRVAGHGS